MFQLIQYFKLSQQSENCFRRDKKLIYLIKIKSLCFKYKYFLSYIDINYQKEFKINGKISNCVRFTLRI
jgi:hypothetical protein